MADGRASLPRSPSSSAVVAAVLCAVLALSAVGCGADEESKRPKGSPPRGEATGSGLTRPPPTATAPSATAPSATAPPGDAEAPPRGAERRGENPESQPGGVGDEEAARAPAMFTGRGGRITPRVVRVPPFLAIAIALRSADGREYTLRFEGFTVGSDKLGRSRPELSGLRPGERVVGKPVGGGPPVVIEASAEPGP